MASGWLLNSLAVLMLFAASVSAIRLVTASWAAVWAQAALAAGSRPSRRRPRAIDADISNVLMCVAMSGMVLHTNISLPPLAWELVFGLLAAWFAMHLIRCAMADHPLSVISSHGAVHFVHCAATFYMFSALKTPYDLELASARCGGSVPSITHSALSWLIVIVLAGYAARDTLGNLSRRRRVSTRNRPASINALASSFPAAACRIAMAVTMMCMLLVA